MTKTPHSIVEQPDERGSALIGVLLLLMMMSALAAALAVSGTTETLISGNQRAGAQAEAAAEAGLNHAVELATTYIFEWKSNGFASASFAIDGLLLGPDGMSGTVDLDADNGSFGTRAGITAAQQIPAFPARLTVAAGIIAQYDARIMDDDLAPGENGVSPFDDLNETLIVRATGYGPNNTTVTLEAVISPADMGALIVDGDLDITGSVDVSGLEGDVHANGDLDIGGSTSISGDVTASGELTGYAGTEGVPDRELPEIHASDYRQYADFILQSDGTITDLAGVLVPTPADFSEWSFDSTGGPDGIPEWSLSSGAPPPTGTYYVRGAVKVTGNPVAQLTLIAEGSIDISGSPDFTADTTELLFVTDGDLEISGGLDALDPLNVGGQILVHEQIKLSGNPALTGQFIVENATSVSTLVTTNEISGHVEIIYNGGLGGGTFTVSGWREVR